MLWASYSCITRYLLLVFGTCYRIQWDRSGTERSPPLTTEVLWASYSCITRYLLLVFGTCYRIQRDRSGTERSPPLTTEVLWASYLYMTWYLMFVLVLTYKTLVHGPRYRIQRDKSDTERSPPLTTEVLWASYSCMTSPTRSLSMRSWTGQYPGIFVWWLLCPLNTKFELMLESMCVCPHIQKIVPGQAVTSLS